jgi:large subunit ribosomal protein L24
MLDIRANKHIKKNDTVMVISGRNKGKTGKVLKIDTAKNSLIIEKVNFIKKHQRPSAKYRQGGIVEREGALRLNIVMLVCPKCAKPTRVKIERVAEGGKKRLCRKCNELIEVKK